MYRKLNRISCLRISESTVSTTQCLLFFFSSRRRHTRLQGDWSSDVCSSDLLGSFDRRKCKGPLNGPKATGDHCPEGWSFHQYPGPGFEGIGENSAESSYYTWVDQHDTFGLGRNVPVSTGNLNDGLIAFAGGRLIVLLLAAP